MTSTAPALTGEEPTRLRRSVTGPLLFLFILGDVLGAGVYALVGVMSDAAGGMFWLPLLVALGMALLTAASYAELVTKYPSAGGSAVFAERAYGRPLISFLVGFAMLAAGVTSAAGLALAFAGDYLGQFLDVPPVAAALVFLALVGLLNARGIQESLRANLVMTTIEVSGLVLVVVLGAVVLGRGDGDLGRLTQLPDGVGLGSAVLAGALIAFYSFVGFETSANIAEEVRDVRRTYPRALFGALLVAGVVYLLIAVVAPSVVAPGDLSGSTGPLLEVVRVAGGVPLELFAVVALIAVANGALLTMIMASRLAYGMADRGLLPSALRARPARAAHALGRDRRHDRRRHAPHRDRHARGPRVHRGPAPAVRLPQHERRRARPAPGRRRAPPLPGPDGDPRAGDRVLPRPAHAAGGVALAARRGAARGRRGPAPAHASSPGPRRELIAPAPADQVRPAGSTSHARVRDTRRGPRGVSVARVTVAAMRLLHTSDWHLGRTLHGVDLLDHQAAHLEHLVDVVRAERVDAVLVAGDVYDRAVPPVEAVTLLSETLARLAER